MTELVRKCSCRWEGGKCRLSSALEGWGCKLLTCMPETVPHTDKEKAKLFAEVYQYADKVGVLECPHYYSQFRITKSFHHFVLRTST